MKKKLLYSIVLVMLIFSLSVPVFAGGRRDRSSQGSSDKVVIFTSMYEYVIDSIRLELRRQFPQYNIEFVYGGTGNIQNRIASERASGKLGCDILMVAEPGYSLELKEYGLLHSFKSREAGNLAFDYDPDGYWYPVRISNMVLAFNPDKYARNTVPQSFFDFAHDPGMRNVIAMRSPLTSGTSMATVTALRDKYGYEYFDALSRQNIQIEYGSDSPLAKLETGEYKVIMILEESILRRRQEGSKLEVIYPTDGTVMIPSSIMIINDKWSANKNSAAAELVADWFLGVEGQNAIVNGWMHSVRTNFNRLPYDSRPTNEIRSGSISVNWDHYFRQRNEIQDRFQDYLATRTSN